MHDKIRIRAFCQFIRQHGEKELIDSLERSGKAGIIYHYDGKLIGDYDKCQSAEEVIRMLERKINIRKMNIGDYDSIYTLWSESAGMGMRSLDDSREGITKFLNRNSETCFIAESDYKIVGVILCGHDGRRGYIYHTAVSTDYRKQGIGKALVGAAIDALKAEGINKAALVAFKTNETGNAFWEAVGFSERDDLVYRNMSINDKNK
jgi:ribosomal protein S18 acetylase RimI-like enzyme